MTAPDKPDALKYLDAMIQQALQHGASDLHVRSDDVPRMRGKDKSIVPMPGMGGPLTSDQITLIITQSVPRPDLAAEFTKTGDCDYSYQSPTARVRVNAYRQKGQSAMVMRVIKPEAATFEMLGLDAARMTKLASAKEGLILVTGPTGSGKSTTLAAILNHIIATRPDNIVTIEDPVEALFPPGRSIISQQEVGKDTTSFAAGIRAAMRQDPDVILIGEMRDKETVDAAMTTVMVHQR